jgi:hypothetical protein
LKRFDARPNGAGEARERERDAGWRQDKDTNQSGAVDIKRVVETPALYDLQSFQLHIQLLLLLLQE